MGTTTLKKNKREGPKSMVNGIILTKLDQQVNIIENIFRKYFNKSVNSIQNLIEVIELNKFNKPIDASKIKVIYRVKTQHSDKITSICLLKDKRLTSSSEDGSIIVYNKAYQTQFHIRDRHEGAVLSLCVLRNGELVSSSFGEIKIWRINEDDYQLIHTLSQHNLYVSKVIELKNDKLSSCSYDKTIKIWDNYQCIQTLTGHNKIVTSIIEMNDYIISAANSTFKDDGELIIWDKSTYKFIKTFTVDFWSNYGLSELNENTLLVGGHDVIYLVDIKNCQINKITESLGYIYSFNVIENKLVLIGNEKGELLCYDLLSKSIISKNKFHEESISCLIKTEDNKIISCSEDATINIYN